MFKFSLFLHKCLHSFLVIFESFYLERWTHDMKIKTFFIASFDTFWKQEGAPYTFPWYLFWKGVIAMLLSAQSDLHFTACLKIKGRSVHPASEHFDIWLCLNFSIYIYLVFSL